VPNFDNDPVVSSDAKGEAVKGVTTAPFAPGVLGVSLVPPDPINHQDPGPGVLGQSDGTGVAGTSKTAHGVFGETESPPGFGSGVFGLHHGAGDGVTGFSENGIGIVGTHGQGGTLAGEFRGAVSVQGNLGVDGDLSVKGNLQGNLGVRGDISVTGDVKFVGADLAEQFDVVGDLAADPGCVVVLAGNDQVRVSDEPYDRKVAGVVSGAGNYRPALVLDHSENTTRRALALTGKVWCKIDADCGSVAVGDMLTSSPTAGHAMRATDPVRAFGAVIGKALGSLDSGRGLLPVLVTLQ